MRINIKLPRISPIINQSENGVNYESLLTYRHLIKYSVFIYRLKWEY